MMYPVCGSIVIPTVSTYFLRAAVQYDHSPRFEQSDCNLYLTGPSESQFICYEVLFPLQLPTSSSHAYKSSTIMETTFDELVLASNRARSRANKKYLPHLPLLDMLSNHLFQTTGDWRLFRPHYRVRRAHHQGSQKYRLHSMRLFQGGY